jgi:hypothetical protein
MVEIRKEGDTPLGLRLRMLPHGGAVQIVGITPNSLASQNPVLSVGQTIVGVNDIDPAALVYMELVNLLSESYTLKLEVSDGAVLFSDKIYTRDAIGSHACSLEANMRVTIGIPLGCPLL